MGDSFRRRRYLLFFAFIATLVFTISLINFRARQEAGGDDRQEGKRVRVDKSLIAFDDGDSFFYGDITIRILGADTPEIEHKEHGIFENQPYGRKAAETTRNLLTKAKVVEYIPYRKDKYGRLLAHVFIDGDLLAVQLIRAGLAYETISYFGDNGFPELAWKILKAASESPPPFFEEPYKWRQKHQKRK